MTELPPTLFGRSADRGEILFNLAIGHQNAGRLAEAAAAYGDCLRLNPALAEAWCNLGTVLQGRNRPDPAAACLARALALLPQAAVAYANLGSAERARGRPEAAAAALRRSLIVDPDYAKAAAGLGLALQDGDRLADAARCFRRAVVLAPGFGQAHNSLGTLQFRRRALGEAAACFRRAITVDPRQAGAHINLGAALLARGDLAQGFREQEWRWLIPEMKGGPGGCGAPRWRGEAGQGRSLLITAEQGLGDSLQFCRFAPAAAARGWRVVVAVQPPLVRLLRTLPGVAEVIAWSDRGPPCDAHCPMMSLPLALDARLDSLPSAPYLRTDAAPWRRRLARAGRPLIGLVWAGAARPDPLGKAVDRRRSMPPQELAPLFAIPDLTFVSLQKGGPPAPEHFPLLDHMAEMEDFADSAALVGALDLVISVDTSMVHLAGALGRPVWLLDRFDACWRWLDRRDDSPWYPTLRIFRQTAPGDWAGVIARVAAALAAAYSR